MLAMLRQLHYDALMMRIAYAYHGSWNASHFLNRQFDRLLCQLLCSLPYLPSRQLIQFEVEIGLLLGLLSYYSSILTFHLLICILFARVNFIIFNQLSKKMIV